MFKPYFFKRVLACVIDYSAVLLFCIIIVLLWGDRDEDGIPVPSAFLGRFSLLFWAFWTIGVEQLFGATVGNTLMGLRPVSLVNPEEKLEFAQSLQRHLLDVLDLSPLGIISILATSKHQRLGDLWAKTVVVSANDTRLSLEGWEEKAFHGFD